MLNYFDRGLLVAAVLALFISGKAILNNFLTEKIEENKIFNLDKKNDLGAVSYYSNDARYKPSNSFNWTKANVSQKIYQSDSIFVGAKSKADVLLNDQSQISIGENSLVVFNKVQQMDLANLKLGNFSLNVNGNVKLAIQDEVIEIKGRQTKVQIFIDKNKKVKPIIKTITGQATVQYKKETHKVSQNEVLPVTVTPKVVTSIETEVPADIRPDLFLANETGPPSAIINLPQPPRIPIPKNEWSESYIYQWKLYDLYKLNGNQLSRRDAPPILVPLEHKLQWKNFPEMQQTTYVMISNSKDFADNFKLVTSEQSEFTVRNAYLGVNYWRLSYDQQNWSITHELHVKAQDREESPEIILLENNLPIEKKPIFAVLHIDAFENAKGLVLEISSAHDFPSQRTEVLWRNSEDIKIPIKKPGILYVRARRVFLNSEISAFSNTVRIDSYRKMYRPKPVSMFQLARRNLDEKFPLTKKIQAQLAPVPMKMENREPSTETTEILSPVAIAPDEYWNDQWDVTQFQLEVSSFMASSSDQKLMNKQQASGWNAGFNFMKWWSHFGIRANFKSKISDSSDASIGSPMQVGLLYMKRLFSGSSLARTQVTGLAGFESYSNSGSSLYSPKYDLLKAGASIELPFAYRWGVGGEALAGYGLDQSKRYELNGRVKYHFKRQMYLGAGYRMQLFEAGSTKSTPSNLPYREVLEEGYSLFGYQF